MNNTRKGNQYLHGEVDLNEYKYYQIHYFLDNIDHCD